MVSRCRREETQRRGVEQNRKAVIIIKVRDRENVYILQTPFPPFGGMAKNHHEEHLRVEPREFFHKRTVFEAQIREKKQHQRKIFYGFILECGSQFGFAAAGIHRLKEFRINSRWNHNDFVRIRDQGRKPFFNPPGVNAQTVTVAQRKILVQRGLQIETAAGNIVNGGEVTQIVK